MLLLLQLDINAQTFEKSRSVSKTFFAGPDTELQVTNKYGDIQLVEWDNDSVKFDISLKVMSTKESKLNNTFDFIDFEFNATPHYIIVKTTFEGGGSFWSDIKDLASTVFTSGTKSQIDYKIYLPKDMKVNLENKFGNIFISDHSGDLNINLSNGDLNTHNLDGENTVNLSFANANINKYESGLIAIGYFSEVHITECNTLKVDSKSSKVYIKKFETLDIQSNRDHMYLGEGNNIDGKLMFTFVNIEKINKKLSIETNYGDFELDNLGKMENGISISSESTDFTITKTKSQSFNLDITYNENAGLFYDQELKNKVSKAVENDNKLVQTTGLLGDTNAYPINFKAKLLSGSLKINNK
ncbi:MAG: hypothetical protein C0598_05245 [Marinilabiliales bacterium]|nr:MAG: hypothetical protein C0598_05245 [Marinilabiliales bacterium]